MLDEIQQSVRAFVASEIAPIAAHIDEADEELPLSLIERMGELGYLGLTFPEKHGGGGLGPEAMAIVTEELARGMLSAASVMTRAILTGSMILDHGSDAQRARYLPGICSGTLITAAAITEPEAGSDVAAVRLRAERDGDGWRLRGQKTWCTHANQAGLLVVLARTGEARHDGLSMFLVDKPAGALDLPELRGSAIPTIGYRGVRSFELSFDGMFVPAEALLGGAEGAGFRQLMAGFEHSRIQTAARAVGVAQAALDAAIAYAKERVQFNVPIAEHQVIRHKLARMSTQIEAARALCMRAAALKGRGERCDLQAGQAKAFAAEMAEWVTSEALQVFGGYGYSREYPAQRYWRDARLFRIFEGTSEIQYEIIAKRLLGTRGSSA